METGKKDYAGNALQVWQDYVAGPDPTNLESRFTAKIEIKDGAPVGGYVASVAVNMYGRQGGENPDMGA